MNILSSKLKIFGEIIAWDRSLETRFNKFNNVVFLFLSQKSAGTRDLEPPVQRTNGQYARLFYRPVLVSVPDLY